MAHHCYMCVVLDLLVWLFFSFVSICRLKLALIFNWQSPTLKSSRRENLKHGNIPTRPPTPATRHSTFQKMIWNKTLAIHFFTAKCYNIASQYISHQPTTSTRHFYSKVVVLGQYLQCCIGCSRSIHSLLNFCAAVLWSHGNAVELQTSSLISAEIHWWPTMQAGNVPSAWLATAPL